MSSALGIVMEAYEEFARKKARFDKVSIRVCDPDYAMACSDAMQETGAAFAEAVEKYVDDRIVAALKKAGLV